MHIGHMIVSALIHGLIYGAIFKVFRHMPLGEVLAVTAGGIGTLWLLSLLFRPRRRR
jgi:hypothetical protein